MAARSAGHGSFSIMNVARIHGLSSIRQGLNTDRAFSIGQVLVRPGGGLGEGAPTPTPYPTTNTLTCNALACHASPILLIFVHVSSGCESVSDIRGGGL